jgi:hypothetical protein
LGFQALLERCDQEEGDNAMGQIKGQVRLTNAREEELDFLVDCQGQRLIPNPAHPQ